MRKDIVYRVSRAFPKLAIETFKFSEDRIREMTIDGDRNFKILSPNNVIPLASICGPSYVGKKFTLLNFAFYTRPDDPRETSITYFAELLFTEVVLLTDSRFNIIKLRGHKGAFLPFSIREYGTAWGLQNLIE